jgi:hypothetical protein
MGCPVMLLWTVEPVQRLQVGLQRAEHLAHQVALQAADDLHLREAPLRTVLDVDAL